MKHYNSAADIKSQSHTAFVGASGFICLVEFIKNIADILGQDSLAAVFGKDTKGPTALLKSVCALNLSRALGVPVLNFNINPDFKDDILKALILGYMKLGGIQMQITCISREQLEEAYRNPELHKNLVVRVGGYSEYFCRLSDELKRMVIERTIQK